ncbi:hypothetical protein Hsero_2139 [Herbaspirillum seropedicae SmR1]|uniref:Uncharacterized protein n=1 Tax=Herbaspirillum seropedicae (strain SmR1) TaxID=757424 RepID=D8IT80_HERSS|nr:hypothetical protein Hsero_2139 [Herbaspirillum seropedicae SmR1]
MNPQTKGQYMLWRLRTNSHPATPNSGKVRARRYKKTRSSCCRATCSSLCLADSRNPSSSRCAPRSACSSDNRRCRNCCSSCSAFCSSSLSSSSLAVRRITSASWSDRRVTSRAASQLEKVCCAAMVVALAWACLSSACR